MRRINFKQSFLAALYMLSLNQAVPTYARELDNIVAIVEDDVILRSELQRETELIIQRLTANKVNMPPENLLKRQVMERLIVEKIQKHLAKSSGINVSNEMLQSAVSDIAQKNHLSLSEFRQQLSSQGMSFKEFEENIRNEIIINRLKRQEIGERINVSDSEVEHYLETQSDTDLDRSQYHLGHILVAIPEGANASTIQKAQQKADMIIEKLRGEGADFKEIAIQYSDSSQALQGGDLGWKTLAQMPTIFVNVASKLNPGQISDPIRSPSGFHIIKLLDFKGLGKQGHTETKTKVRHILIKTNDLIDDAEARKRILSLKARLEAGEKFETLARAHSDDKGSAIKGGELGWVTPGAMVPAFENAMNNLAVNALSNPVQTEFGWHLVQVLGRETQNNDSNFKKQQAQEAIRERKIEEETELWLRRLRDEAYVEIFEDRL